MRVLDRKDLGVGVGDEHEPATCGSHLREKAARLGQPVDLVPHRAL